MPLYEILNPFLLGARPQGDPRRRRGAAVRRRAAGAGGAGAGRRRCEEAPRRERHRRFAGRGRRLGARRHFLPARPGAAPHAHGVVCSPPMYNVISPSFFSFLHGPDP